MDKHTFSFYLDIELIQRVDRVLRLTHRESRSNTITWLLTLALPMIEEQLDLPPINGDDHDGY